MSAKVALNVYRYAVSLKDSDFLNLVKSDAEIIEMCFVLTNVSLSFNNRLMFLNANFALEMEKLRVA